MNFSCFATVARSLEALAAKELESLGALDVKPDFTGVHFRGDKRLLYRVNLWSRIIFRVLVTIAEVKSYQGQQLYRNVQNIDWDLYLHPDLTLAVHCTGKNQNLNHTHFTALQISKAITDQQKSKWGKRSSIDVKKPDILVNAHIHESKCILSLDSSGTSLHRRGYREAMGLAPLKETLAAALLDMAEWQPEITFFDPLCGSGTLVLEAALKGLNIAPGLSREGFGFQSWLDFDASLWNELVTEAKSSQLTELTAPILGSDQDREILAQAKNNACTCRMENYVRFFHAQLCDVEPPTPTGIIVCNPPYGKRIGNQEELGDLYKQLGDTFKQHFKGWTAYILTGNKQLSKRIGLRTSRRIPVYNGAIPCTLLKYELY